ncbi:hypothetical protein SEA_GIBBLES_77 [Gordonia phage Gibbles]|nr:hypothetical protein SEA_GIBBLES_77 [Gordonia phage Gibbles]
MSASKKDKGKLRVSVVVDAEVDEAEWMEHYGDYIRKHGLSPSATFGKAVKKQSKIGMMSLGLETLEMK